MHNERQSSYLFFLGREADLAFVELSTTLTTFGLPDAHRLTSTIAVLSLPDLIIEDLTQRLAGTVKIAYILEDHAKLLDQVACQKSAVAAILYQSQNRDKYTISVSQILLSPKTPRYQGLTSQIKRVLEQQDKKIRFVEGKQSGLSSVQFTSNQFMKKGTEILVLTDQARTIIAQTLWVQDFKDWIKRDFGRPNADPVRGMLPPKLARMLINITHGQAQVAKRKAQSARRLPSEPTELTKPTQPTNLLDPFCGEGTILQEGLALGFNVIGVDIDQKAVAHSEDNIRWFVRQYQERYPSLAQQTWQVLQADVGSLAQNQTVKPAQIIVTEPYLGPAFRQKPVKSEIQALKITYQANFKKLLQTAQTIQPPGGILAFIAPAVLNGKFSQSIMTKSLLDSCENFGYTPIQGPLHYARNDAKIGREIYFLRRTDKSCKTGM